MSTIERLHDMNKPLVLAVEDHPIEQKVLKHLCEHLGLNVKIVPTPSEALSLLTPHHQFWLVLMNWSIPRGDDKVLDGLDCTRRIRRFESLSGRHVPIIAVTARAMLGDRRQCLEAGMDDYLSKPFTTEQFQSKILYWLPTPIQNDTIRLRSAM